jgi:hypothetical protein
MGLFGNTRFLKVAGLPAYNIGPARETAQGAKRKTLAKRKTYTTNTLGPFLMSGPKA